MEMVTRQVAGRGVKDERVLGAMRCIPRELFLEPGHQLDAYEDRALFIGWGQTISQPYVVGFMTEALRLQPEHRVLEIGTGTGYQTAILAMLARHVFTIERIAALGAAAQARLARLGAKNVSTRIGDGCGGWPEHAPFDRILVSAAPANIPPALIEQLAENGRLVLPLGEEGAQRLTIVEKVRGRIIERPSIGVRFVPLVGDTAFRAAL